MWYRGLLDLIIVSEPLTIVPAEYDYPKPRYPMYNYPPALIKNDDEFAYKERKICYNPIDRETRLEFKEPESSFCEKKSRRHEIIIAIITSVVGNNDKPILTILMVFIVDSANI